MAVIDSATVVAADLHAVAETEETDWDIYASRMHLKEDVRYEVLDQLRTRIATGHQPPVLFDVGAGTGDFLDIARAHDFMIRGNDISASAIEHAAKKHGIELSSEDLADQPAESVDALTMWCVVAHVADPRAFLTDAQRFLRPGGAMFLRTPRWSRVDQAATAIARGTGGRVAKLSDQRVTRGHLHLFSDEGMRRLLKLIGFSDIEVRPVVHSGCAGREIAGRLGGPQRIQQAAGRAIDGLLSTGRGPRNTMFVYARRPARRAQ